MNGKGIVCVVTALLFAGAAANLLYGQATGQITGTIIDSSGAVVDKTS
jgi:hypothetical protein